MLLKIRVPEPNLLRSKSPAIIPASVSVFPELTEKLALPISVIALDKETPLIELPRVAPPEMYTIPVPNPELALAILNSELSIKVSPV